MRPLVDRIATAANRPQEQDLLLDVGRRVEQVHDLGHPGLGDPGQFGLAGDHAVAEELVEPDPQSHQARDPRHAADVIKRQFRAVEERTLIRPGDEGLGQVVLTCQLHQPRPLVPRCGANPAVG